MTAGFSFRVDTARAGIDEKLKSFKAGPDSVVNEVKDKTGKVVTSASKTPANQDQIEFVKDAILKRINLLDEKFDGVMVIATGQSDPESGRSAFSVQIYGKQNHL